MNYGDCAHDSQSGARLRNRTGRLEGRVTLLLRPSCPFDFLMKSIGSPRLSRCRTALLFGAFASSFVRHELSRAAVRVFVCLFVCVPYGSTCCARWACAGHYKAPLQQRAILLRAGPKRRSGGGESEL